MGFGGGMMNATIEVGEMARLPDGTSAEVTQVEDDTIYGTRRLSGGKAVRFHTGRMQWAFLRDGIIPESNKTTPRNYCDDDLRMRRWNPHTGKCDSCGRWIPKGHTGHREL